MSQTIKKTEFPAEHLVSRVEPDSGGVQVALSAGGFISGRFLGLTDSGLLKIGEWIVDPHEVIAWSRA
jgi:hypothetical protein